MKRLSNPPAIVERLWPLLGLVLALGAFTLVASSISPALSRSTTVMLINLVVVVGLYIFIGNSGVPSFGHTAFMAVGAYVGALLAMDGDTKQFLFPELPHFLISLHLAPVPAILLGGLGAAVLALVVGVPIARMSPLAASLGTFAVLAVVFNVVNNLKAIGGSSGISSAPAVISLGSAYLWAVAMIALAFAYQGTRWCLRLRATREDEPAAGSVGISVARERFLSLVVSAFVCGVGGGIYALNLGFFTPNAFYLSTAFLILVMLLVGGATSLAGAVAGVLSIFVIQEVLKEVESGTGASGVEGLVLALLLVVIMIKRPLGIMGGREIPWPLRRRAAAAAAPSGPAGQVDDPAAAESPAEVGR